MLDSVTVIVGHYRKASRTSLAAQGLAALIAPGKDVEVVELATYSEWLLTDPKAPALASIKEDLEKRSSIVVVASPTYKGTYTGILKLFFEQFAGGSGLQGLVAVPMMMAGNARHAMAGEVFLKPLLVELGATCPTEAIVVSENEDAWRPEIQQWYTRWGAAVRAAAIGATSL